MAELASLNMSENFVHYCFSSSDVGHIFILYFEDLASFCFYLSYIAETSYLTIWKMLYFFTNPNYWSVHLWVFFFFTNDWQVLSVANGFFPLTMQYSRLNKWDVFGAYWKVMNLKLWGFCRTTAILFLSNSPLTWVQYNTLPSSDHVFLLNILLFDIKML